MLLPWIRKAILVPKVIIDGNELDSSVIQSLDKLASFFDRLDNPYRMPELMSQWLDHYNDQHKVDTFYSVPVGYSAESMSLLFTFKRDMMVLEFRDPYGTRLMELRLHK